MSEFEHQIKNHAKAFQYPPTPPIHVSKSRKTGIHHTQTLRLALIGALLLLALPLYAVIEGLQIGAIRIIINDNNDETPAVSPLDLSALPGAIAVHDAGERFPYRLKLPAALDEPHHAFILSDDQIVILVWLSDDQSKVDWLLYQIVSENGYGYKLVPELIGTTVHDRVAIWMDKPHLLFDDTGQMAQPYAHLVQANVLVWNDDQITYRLETTADLETARTVAESLR